MTFTDVNGYAGAFEATQDERVAVTPPRKRVTPSLFINDILTTERGVPTLLAHWFAARDMQAWTDKEQ